MLAEFTVGRIQLRMTEAPSSSKPVTAFLSPSALRLSDCPFHLICDLSWRKFSAFKGSCDYVGPTQIIQNHLPAVKSVTLITSEKSLLPHNVTYSQVPEIRARSSLEALCLLLSHVPEVMWPRSCPTAWSLGRKQYSNSQIETG